MKYVLIFSLLFFHLPSKAELGPNSICIVKLQKAYNFKNEHCELYYLKLEGLRKKDLDYSAGVRDSVRDTQLKNNAADLIVEQYGLLYKDQLSYKKIIAQSAPDVEKLKNRISKSDICDKNIVRKVFELFDSLKTPTSPFDQRLFTIIGDQGPVCNGAVFKLLDTVNQKIINDQKSTNAPSVPNNTVGGPVRRQR